MGKQNRQEVIDGSQVEKPSFDIVEREYQDETEGYDLNFMYSDSLEELEDGVRKAEKLNNAVWFMQAIAIYRIFNDLLFVQSGLTKQEYEQQARSRLNMDRRRLSDMYQAGSFIYRYHSKMIEKGWTPEGQARKMTYADRALRRHGDPNVVIDHLINDSKEEFAEFAKGEQNATRTQDLQPRDDITMRKDTVYIGGVPAVTLSDELPKDEKTAAWTYIKKLFSAIRDGYYPEIVPCYDSSEGKRIQNLLKKDRQQR